ncbi:MAG: aminotransferase class I/II-fold pyridoxal phosphate-dependent enzyme [Candidatus Melainabacteria bacterium]
MPVSLPPDAMLQPPDWSGRLAPRRAVAKMATYHPPLEGRRGKTRLDFNENTVGFPGALSPLATELITAYPEYGALTTALARQWGIPEAMLLLTNGSDEALCVAASTFVEPGESTALCVTPTFPMIPHYLKLADSHLTQVPMTRALTYDLDAISEALKEFEPTIAVFASPDNPTGALLAPEHVSAWCAAHPQTAFVLDEAYYPYATQTVLPLISRFENLMVTRTFSKAWGLAGLRLGVLIAHPEIIAWMKRVRSPYSVNTLAVETALRLIPDEATVLREAAATMGRKAHVVSAVCERGYHVLAGHGNFFLMQAGLDAEALCDFCAERGVLLRNRSAGQDPEAPMFGLVRVTVGTDTENEQLLSCLDAFRQSRVLMFDLDGTLVDTTRSFDTTIATLVEKYAGKPLAADELRALRAEGGFNDDWDATLELLKRRGVEKTYADIQDEATALYLTLAKAHETWLVDPAVLKQLARRYRMAVATGRTRNEYDPVWRDALDPLLERVTCQDDDPAAGRKPSPDMLVNTMRHLGVTGGIYVGNAVDDAHAALAAGLTAVAVATTHTADLLRQAGAAWVLPKTGDLPAYFGLNALDAVQ